MNFLRRFGIAFLLACALVVFDSEAFAAQGQEPYQFDDIIGTSGIGNQWVGFASSFDNSPERVRNSVGASVSFPMEVSGDIVYRNNPVSLLKATPVRGNLLNSALLVITEGLGSMPVEFIYSGAEPAVTLSVNAGNFETSYPWITNSPTPSGINSVRADITFERNSGSKQIYDSSLGELIFHQNPDMTPSQSTHVPFVIANVHEGDAKNTPLDIKSTTRNTSGDIKSGDIVARRWFDWTVQADKIVQPNPVDWIFVPLADPVINKNPQMMYNFITEVTNHTALRYGVQRYDGDNSFINAAYWKFDFQAADARLPKRLPFDPLSHIVPGVVTVYSQSHNVTVGQQDLLRLAAVDPFSVLGSKKLQLRYRTIYGYNLGSKYDSGTNPLWTLNAFQPYPSDTNFLDRAVSAMALSGKYSSPASGVSMDVRNIFITADALSSFKMSAPVPVISGDAAANSILGLNVVLRIPKTDPQIAPLWEAFAASRNLANDFARHFSVWFRSPTTNDPDKADLNVTQLLKEENKYDRAIKVFLDEEKECVTVHYVLLLVESNNGTKNKSRIRIVSDTTLVNDYDYIVVSDGINDGVWDMTFFVAPEKLPPEEEEDKSGGGCSAVRFAYLPLLFLIALLPVKFKNIGRIVKMALKSIFVCAIFLIVAHTALAAEGDPLIVRYESDGANNGTLRWAISQINAGAVSADIILVDNLHTINISGDIEISADMIIEGNGAAIKQSGTGTGIFRVESGDVTFRNISFQSGRGANGGAVSVTGGGNIFFDKCTFDNNKTAGDGGAVFADGDVTVKFENCTFFKNVASGDGGAVYGTANSTLQFSFTTMNSNSAVGLGQAVAANGIDNAFTANIIAGNGDGQQIETSPVSRSFGYNVLEDTESSLQWTRSQYDIYEKDADDIFDSTPPELRRNDAAPSWRNWPYTLGLKNSTLNPALGIIPISEIISMNVLVDQRFVTRVNGSRPGSPGAFQVYDPSEPVKDFKIGGLPNGIATVGFAAILATYVSPMSADKNVFWTSQNTNVIATTAYGKIYSVGKGSTILTATTVGYDESGRRKNLSIPVKVIYDAQENPGGKLPDPNVGGEEPPKNEGGGGCNTGFAVVAALILSAFLLGIRKANLKLFLFFVLLVVSILGIVGSADALTASLNYTKWQLVVGKSFELIVTTDSLNNPTWTSINDSVVTVQTSSGKNASILATGQGAAAIECTVTSTDGVTTETLTVSCDVTVYPIGMKGVTLKPSPLTLKLGTAETKATLVPVYDPPNAVGIAPIWSNSTPAVVSMDDKGNVEALTRGTSTITYSVTSIPEDGGDMKPFSTTCEITVLRAIDSITINQAPSLDITVGTSKDVTVTVAPADADNQEIEWFISPDNMQSNFILSPDAKGSKLTITAKSFVAPNYTKDKNPVKLVAKSIYWLNVPEASIDVIVHPIEIVSVVISPEKFTLPSGDIYSVDLKVRISPTNATMAKSLWSNSNQLAASLIPDNTSSTDYYAKARVTGTRQGVPRITYTFTGWIIEPNKTHTPKIISVFSDITVLSPPPRERVSGITLEPKSIDLRVGETRKLVSVLTPSNANNKTVYWNAIDPSSENLLYDTKPTSVVKVTQDGTVTALSAGKALITATPEDRGVAGDIGPVVCSVDVTVVGSDNPPSTVNILPAIRDAIGEKNEILRNSGVEINFGFPNTKRPNESSLKSYGASPTILTSMFTMPRIELATRPQNPKIGDSATFEFDVSSQKGAGNSALLPVSVKMTLTEQDLIKYLPDGANIAGILANPSANAAIIFSSFSIQKQIIDPPAQSAQKFAVLIPKAIGAQAAVSDGILLLKGLGDKIEVTLNYYVADSDNTNASYIEKNLIIGDGAFNGIIRDPIWIAAGSGDNPPPPPPSSGGGGCNATVLILGLIPFAILLIMKRRMR